MTSGIGDVTSNERGSGARFNAGKTPFELLPLALVFANIPSGTLAKDKLWVCVEWLAEFQRSGSKRSLRGALRESMRFEGISAFEDCAKVLEFGKKKYAPWNWAKGMPWSVPLGCAVRHLISVLEKGEDNDPESGLPHLAHVQANLMMLLLYVEKYPEGNDLPIGLL